MSVPNISNSQSLQGVAGVNCLQFRPSSTCRKVREFFGTIQSIIQLIRSLFSSVNLSERNITYIKNHQDCLHQQGVLSSVLKLKSGGMLGANDIIQYANVYSSLMNVHEGLMRNTGNNEISMLKLPELKDIDKSIMAIPVVLHGKVRNHIVAVIVDKAGKAIEFYDSKGLTVKDRGSDKLEAFPKSTLKDLFDIISNKYSDGTWEIKENTKRHQSDGYNSGVYVSDYLKRRAIGESFDRIVNKGLTFKEASSSVRSDMVHEILHHIEKPTVGGLDHDSQFGYGKIDHKIDPDVMPTALFF